MDPRLPAIRRCMLQDAVGRSEACPEAVCPFWEEGGAVLDGGCFLERILPFEDWTPELAQRWLRVRARLAAKRIAGRCSISSVNGNGRVQSTEPPSRFL